MRTVFVFILLALIAVPATAAEFYIVQDIQKQTCTVSQGPPKGDGFAMVGDGAYGDETTASLEMKRMSACSPPTDTEQSPATPTKQ